jgi:hypothetical protein
MKRSIAVLALLALVATGAFAQLAIGFTGAIYDENLDFGNAADRFQNGDHIFYGPFVELGLGKLALGLSANFSFYKEDYSYYQDGSYMMDMMDYDVSLYLQIHAFKYKSFIDPFFEAGIGMMAKDYQSEDDDPDTDNPLMATKYTQLGAGLGVNLGAIGVFTKVLYMFPFGNVESSDVWVTNSDGTAYKVTYTIDDYPLNKLKIYLGAKLIL